MERKGVFCALYTQRGSHFWLTPGKSQKTAVGLNRSHPAKVTTAVETRMLRNPADTKELRSGVT